MTALRVLTGMASRGRRAPSLMLMLPGALQTPDGRRLWNNFLDRHGGRFDGHA